jgi:DNA gyrase subunit A
MTNNGQTIRTRCQEISVLGRNTQGVRLMDLKDGEYVTSVAVLEDDDTKEE